MLELDWVRQLADRGPHIRALGVCLDSDPVAVPSMLADRKIPWPVYCDGRGWQGDLVRRLGLNAIPALWIVDRKCVLRALDARENAVTIIDSAAGP